MLDCLDTTECGGAPAFSAGFRPAGQALIPTFSRTLEISARALTRLVVKPSIPYSASTSRAAWRILFPGVGAARRSRELRHDPIITDTGGGAFHALFPTE